MTTTQAPELLRNQHDQMQLAFPGVEFGERTLRLPPGMAFEEWQRLGGILRRIAENALFWLGEWAIYGEREFGEAYAQAISEESGYSVESVKVAQWVAERVPAERRSPDLSWAHHRAVAALEPEQQEHWLGEAAAEGMTSKELYERSRGSRSEPPQEPSTPAALDPLADACRLLAQLRYEEGQPVSWPSEAEVAALLSRLA